MSILVTGGCGFIGSNVLNYLIPKYPNKHFYNIDKLDYCSSIDNVIKSDNYTLIVGNICDVQLITQTLSDYNIDVIIHIAAQTHVDNSFGNSIQFTYDNVLGTHTLLECCKNYGKITLFIHMSTDEVYGEVDINHTGCDEISILNPTNPYAATKAGAEFLCRSYLISFKLPIIIVRGNNVYGSNQYPEKLIPKTINHILNHQKCIIHGSGNTRRNFIHAFDVATAIEIIMLNGRIGEIYNIGTNDEYSVLDIVKMILHDFQIDDHIDDHIQYVDDRPFNDFRYSINTSKLENLGWKKSIPFHTGLIDTILHYKSKL